MESQADASRENKQRMNWSRHTFAIISPVPGFTITAPTGRWNCLFRVRMMCVFVSPAEHKVCLGKLTKPFCFALYASCIAMFIYSFALSNVGVSHLDGSGISLF